MSPTAGSRKGNNWVAKTLGQNGGKLHELTCDLIAIAHIDCKIKNAIVSYRPIHLINFVYRNYLLFLRHLLLC